MSWIDDVVTLTTIASTWGNNIRNRIVQTFDTTAERDAHTATLPIGSMCNITDIGASFVRQGGATPRWQPLQLAVLHGAPVFKRLGPGMTDTINSLNTPAGYRYALVNWIFEFNAGPGLDYSVAANLYSAGGTVRQLSGQWTGAADGARAQSASPNSVVIACAFGLNLPGDGIVASVTNLGAGSLSGDVEFSADPFLNNLSVVLIP